MYILCGLENRHVHVLKVIIVIIKINYICIPQISKNVIINLLKKLQNNVHGGVISFEITETLVTADSYSIHD